ncbi:hypothetical protein H5410_022738 [Solanum commersonii]|uniref:Uncharacterized protein n=1 Tax=Solanum commersonii TaxID=4109 RepID=A0A9J5ZEW7_SOLCO|nr:hypothetical protein H5410_022738 [Solanum commersonii]
MYLHMSVKNQKSKGLILKISTWRICLHVFSTKWRIRKSAIRNEGRRLISELSVTSHLVSIKQLETQMGQIASHLNLRKKGGLPSDTLVNLKNE